MAKTLVADSSSIISLAINCMSSVLAELGPKIVVTDAIYNEIVSRPMKSKRYALESIRIRKLFSEGVISVRKPDPKVTRRILEDSNSVYRIRKRPLSLVHLGEAEALALLSEVDADALLIDERTTRMLMEDAEGLRGILEDQNNSRVDMDTRRLESFRRAVDGIDIIRSSEIAAVAYEKGILSRNLGFEGKDALMASLYALKFSGCAISWQEIEDYARVLG